MPDKVILAIVGSTLFEKDEPASVVAKNIMLAAIEGLSPSKIISGGAVGIDTLAKELANELGIPFEEFLPKNRRWAPDGFKARNVLITEACTHLLAIRHHNWIRTNEVTGWTADTAEFLGRKVERHLI